MILLFANMNKSVENHKAMWINIFIFLYYVYLLLFKTSETQICCIVIACKHFFAIRLE